jgi:predicted NBD/HSP70 family sugar kinase
LNSSTNIKYAIGIDLGGTFIKAGIVDSNGKLLMDTKTDSYADVSPKKVIAQIEKVINELKTGFDEKISGIGIGSPGIVVDGKVKYPPNFRNWRVVNLKNEIKDKFGIETAVDNDANCAGLAELKFGYGRKIKNFIFLTLGTGIGGAIIINDQLYRGEKCGAGEFGWTSINFNGPHGLGGNPGAVETYIGRNYFLQSERNEIKKLGKNIDFKELTEFAKQGNKTALSLFDKYGFYLGAAITNYFNLMDVRTCIVTGGIANVYPFFIDSCRNTIRERALKTIRDNFKVLHSKIKEAGVLGAAGLVLT